MKIQRFFGRIFGVKTFLVTHFGKAYTAPGFGNWFREMCNAADCLDVSAHGLRKATARRLAEIGCSANQIAASTCTQLFTRMLW